MPKPAASLNGSSMIVNSRAWAASPHLASAGIFTLTRWKRNDSLRASPLLIELRDHSYEPMRNLELLSEDVRNAIQHRTAREAEAQACLGST